MAIRDSIKRRDTDVRGVMIMTITMTIKITITMMMESTDNASNEIFMLM